MLSHDPLSKVGNLLRVLILCDTAQYGNTLFKFCVSNKVLLYFGATHSPTSTYYIKNVSAKSLFFG